MSGGHESRPSGWCDQCGGPCRAATLRPLPAPHTVWRHYKGGLYVVLAVGRLSEQRDGEVVTYRSCKLGHVWTRPLAMWLEFVDGPEGVVPRYELVEGD